MKNLKNNAVIGILSFVFLMSTLAFHQGPKPLATVKKGAKGFTYTNIDKSSINTKISNGYFRLTKVDFYYVDNKFYLVRHVTSVKGKKAGYLFSEVKRVKDKLYPILKPEFYWPCWQVVNCQCDRPSKYESCRCTAGSGGCVQDWGWGGSFPDPFEKIFAW